MNDGTCFDNHTILPHKFVCICSEGFSGIRCTLNATVAIQPPEKNDSELGEFLAECSHGD